MSNDANELAEWEKLSSNAHDVMKDLGDFGPTVHAYAREVKGYIRCEDGEDGRTYYDSNDLRRIAEGCLEVACWLDLRAAKAEQPKAPT